MQRNRIFCVGCLFLLSTAISAQEPEPAGVSGEGTVTLERPASRMRMTIELSEKGPTVKEALAKLSERREAAKLLLQTLDAAKQSIKFAKPGLAAEDDSQRRQMEAMLQERISRGGRVPKGLQMAKSVTVNCTLTAEWPLPEMNEEDLLVRTKELQDKITAADLAGLKEPKERTPEEAELEEELAAMSSDRYYDDSEAKPGEPAFVYLASISETELDKAMEEAFGKAKLKADRLARAAGGKLGELATLKRLDAGLDLFDDYAYSQSAYRNMSNVENLDETESQSPLPGTVRFQFHIIATFRLSKN
jgi:uncharacterized protein YggE